DIPIGDDSDLLRNLRAALLDLGDPYQPLLVAVREAHQVALTARVARAPDYLWDDVYARVHQALFDTFGFHRRELGQPVFASEIVDTIQRVPGVRYVDLERLFAMSPGDPTIRVEPVPTLVVPPGGVLNTRLESALARWDDAVDPPVILPAQLFYLNASLSETVNIQEA
ncbi:MAG: hypothetical protein GYB65_17305, partial [Chloroflexi bacterium]|nr:hypothetical protein [Chloroflexota bacterium]